MTTWWILMLAVLYVGTLFALANWAERRGGFRPKSQTLIYSLALTVYCTSWTYYGAVGSAVSSGLDYVPIYLGPILLYLFGFGLLKKLLAVSRQHNVTSLTDFISARYGKRHGIAALTAFVCLIVVVPYVALQLKAVANAYSVLVPTESEPQQWYQDTALWSAVAMATFAMLFGSRKISLTEHNRGVLTTVAFESVIKLVALVALAFAVVWSLQGPHESLFAQFWQHQQTLSGGAPTVSFFTKTLLGATAIFLLPRQFHVTFVENQQPSQLNTARFFLVGYLLAVTVVVPPIAMAGLQIFPSQLHLADSFVLQIPVAMNWDFLTSLVFIGGFSAATSMIIIATLALGTMISNDVVMPAILRRSQTHGFGHDYSQLILRVRRLMILLVMVLSYGFYSLFARHYVLAETGLLAFSLVIQLAPAVIGGLYWRKGHAYGVYAGVSVGVLLWFYCLMLPQLVHAQVVNNQILTSGLFAQAWLKPTALFGNSLDPLSQGVMFSLCANMLAYITVSLLTKAQLQDRLQAVAFVRPLQPLPDDQRSLVRNNASNADLMTLLERFVGTQRAAESLAEYAQRFDRPAPSLSPQLSFVRHVERELAGVIGSSSASGIVKAVLDGRELAFEDVVTLFDDTRQAIQFSRKILFSTLENLSQGVSVVDRDLQLVAWNKQYLNMFDYPEGLIRVGRPIADIVRFNAERGLCGPGSPDEHVAKRLTHMRNATAHVFQRVRPDGRVIEICGNPIPGGGFVTSFTDITDHVMALQELASAKIFLEQRVQERTAQISQINDELRAENALRAATELQLLQAKAEAEAANASKTRFLALTSHDILQPLNAARLFAASLHGQVQADGQRMLSQLENSLKATEDLMSTLLDIARLDEGKLDLQQGPVDLRALLNQLSDEMQLLAKQKELQLRVHCGPYWVLSHSTYLRRILQNLLSNAIKYTNTGKVIVGCRRHGKHLWVEVWDSGPGLQEVELPLIFQDFYRVQQTARGQSGVGLGLGVVQRMARALGHSLDVRSQVGKGSCFRIQLAVTEPPSAQLIEIESVAGINRLPSAQRILCVDDDATNLAALSTLLQQWQEGDVMALTDVQQVLALTQAPDIAIIDYQLNQNLDGLQLWQQLRQRFPHLVGVLVSAAPEPTLPRQATELDMVFLPKPIKPAALRAVLKSFKLRPLKEPRN
ncbi:MAG TPA: hybrid sensor histidine kinase/response regulator [Rheinheimera sp.]|nr:hybrid sensor histidine kinase/response regulator [Rheinheimera sp.]